MNRDALLRRALWASVPYNVGAAFIFAFPSSWLGQLAGLPTPVPRIYGVLLAAFALLFGGAYAWLALQRTIDRPMVALSAFGKAAAFGIVAAFWLFDAAPGRGVLFASGDILFAGVFAWWLAGARADRLSDASAPLGQ